MFQVEEIARITINDFEDPLGAMELKLSCDKEVPLSSKCLLWALKK